MSSTKQPPFMSFHDYALSVLDRLERTYLVDRVETRDFSWPWKETYARPAIKLVPQNANEAPLTLAFPVPEGVFMRFGRWYSDEIASVIEQSDPSTSYDEEVAYIEQMIRIVTTSDLYEFVRPPPRSGAGELTHEFSIDGVVGYRSSTGLSSAERAQELIAGGDAEYRWQRWSLR